MGPWRSDLDILNGQRLASSPGDSGLGYLRLCSFAMGDFKLITPGTLSSPFCGSSYLAGDGLREPTLAIRFRCPIGRANTLMTWLERYHELTFPTVEAIVNSGGGS